MEQKTIGTILKAVGIAVGVVSAILLFKWYPIHVGTLVLGAVIYFVGDRF